MEVLRTLLHTELFAEVTLITCPKGRSVLRVGLQSVGKVGTQSTQTGPDGTVPGWNMIPMCLFVSLLMKETNQLVERTVVSTGGRDSGAYSPYSNEPLPN